MINDAVNNGYPPTAPARESVPALSAVAVPVNSATSSAASASDQEKAPAPAPQEVHAAVQKLNDYVQNLQRTLSFSVDDATGTTVVKVFDTVTNELVRQIPSEDTLKLASTINEQSVHLLMDERA